MKWSLLIILLIVLPLTSAAEIQITKNSSTFDQGETLIAVASGNFINQVTSNNVLFYQDHTRVPMIHEVKKVDGDFYIYALLKDKPSGNYSLRIEDISYTVGTETKEDDLISNFIITNELAEFSTSKGFLTYDEGTSIEIQNLKSSKITVDISTDLTTSETQIELSSGQTKKINFYLNTETVNKTFTKIILSSNETSYQIPVFIENPLPLVQDGEINFRIEPSQLEISLPTNSSTKRIAYILNSGDVEIDNLLLSVSSSLSPYVTITPEKINNFDTGDSEKIELLINSSEEELNLSGTISIQNEDIENSLILLLGFIKDYTPPEGDNSSEDKTSCSQFNATLCTTDETCTGDILPSSDKGKCCLAPGTCEPSASKGSSTGKIIGWGIIVLVLVLLFWFFKRYEKMRPKIDLLKIGKGER